MIKETLFTSKNDEWETPQEIFDALNTEFVFDIDACATEQNRKCDKYFSEAEDGLIQDWGGAQYGVIHHIARLISG